MTSGQPLTDAQRKQVVAHLEVLLQRDTDPGVRSRAATVLGECGSPLLLPVLWKLVLGSEDNRVQEKAWTALVEILARSEDLALVQEWDRLLTTARQGPRRLHMLGELATRWLKRPESRPLAMAAQELLIQAQLALGKRAAALPLIREQLARPSTEAEMNKRLGWLLTAGEQALQDGERAEVQRLVQEAQPYLPRTGPLAESFEKLSQAANRP